MPVTETAACHPLRLCPASCLFMSPPILSPQKYVHVWLAIGNNCMEEPPRIVNKPNNPDLLLSKTVGLLSYWLCKLGARGALQIFHDCSRIVLLSVHSSMFVLNLHCNDRLDCVLLFFPLEDRGLTFLPLSRWWSVMERWLELRLPSYRQNTYSELHIIVIFWSIYLRALHLTLYGVRWICLKSFLNNNNWTCQTWPNKNLNTSSFPNKT